MQNPRSLLDNFGVLSRNLKGLEVSPKLKASSIFWNTDGVATVFKEEERKTIKCASERKTNTE
jgi:hypothetical protein